MKKNVKVQLTYLDSSINGCSYILRIWPPFLGSNVDISLMKSHFMIDCEHSVYITYTFLVLSHTHMIGV